MYSSNVPGSYLKNKHVPPFRLPKAPRRRSNQNRRKAKNDQVGEH